MVGIVGKGKGKSPLFTREGRWEMPSLVARIGISYPNADFQISKGK